MHVRNGYRVMKVSETKQTLTDLILEDILFENEDNALEILQRMFPNRYVSVNIERNGSGSIFVDDVKVSFTP